MAAKTTVPSASRCFALAVSSAVIAFPPRASRRTLPRVVSRRGLIAEVGIVSKPPAASLETQQKSLQSPSQRRGGRQRRRRGELVVSSAAAESREDQQQPRRRSRSRSRSRSRRPLLPSLEDLRPRNLKKRFTVGDDEDDNEDDSSPSLLSQADDFSTASTSTNNVLSAVALIVGSSVGAGVLALPAVSAPAGLAPSAATLVGVWALLTAEALLIAEVNLSLLSLKKQERLEKKKKKKRGSFAGEDEADSDEDEADSDEDEDAIVTLREMAHETLGARGGHFVAAAYLALSYSLMVAYISKAGELVSSALDPVLSTALPSSSSAAALLTPEAGALLFTAAMGATLFGGTAAVDSANKAMTSALLIAYAVIVGVGGAQADWGGVLAGTAAPPHWGAAAAAVPVVLLSLVYHDLVPVVCAQLRGDASSVRKALFIGSAAPLAMFVLWDAVALALVGGGGGGNGIASPSFVDPLELLMSSGGGAVGAAIGAFSLLAIVTSCLGTALGLSSTLTAEIKGLVVAAAGAGGGGEEDRANEAEKAAVVAPLPPLPPLATPSSGPSPRPS